MDYEKKYKEALERAKRLHCEPTGGTERIVCEQIFPELKESEDERIRKAIHIYLDWLDGRKDYTPKGEYSIKDMIAWLEKQGEQKNFAPKVEPKFKKGDWVVWKVGELSATLQIVNVDTDKKLYRFNDNSCLPIVDEECLYHWTIQDAKDGDVLYSPCLSLLWIFKSKDTIYCGCNLNYNDGAFCGEGYFEKPTDAIPATKEQRDLLFKKMDEAGYEWDALSRTLLIKLKK